MRHGRNDQQWLIELRARKLKLTYYHELIELGRTQSNLVELGRTQSPKLELMAEFNISDQALGRTDQQWLIESRARELKLTYYHEHIKLSKLSETTQTPRTR